MARIVIKPLTNTDNMLLRLAFFDKLTRSISLNCGAGTTDKRKMSIKSKQRQAKLYFEQICGKEPSRCISMNCSTVLVLLVREN
jgi:hypothetical protein